MAKIQRFFYAMIEAKLALDEAEWAALRALKAMRKAVEAHERAEALRARLQATREAIQLSKELLKFPRELTGTSAPAPRHLPTAAMQPQSQEGSTSCLDHASLRPRQAPRQHSANSARAARGGHSPDCLPNAAPPDLRNAG